MTTHLLQPLHSIRIRESMGLGVAWILSPFSGGRLDFFPGHWAYVDRRGHTLAHGHVDEIIDVKVRRGGGVEITLAPQGRKKRWLLHGIDYRSEEAARSIRSMLDTAKATHQRGRSQESREDRAGAVLADGPDLPHAEAKHSLDLVTWSTVTSSVRTASGTESRRHAVASTAIPWMWMAR